MPGSLSWLRDAKGQRSSLGARVAAYGRSTFPLGLVKVSCFWVQPGLARMDPLPSSTASSLNLPCTACNVPCKCGKGGCGSTAWIGRHPSNIDLMEPSMAFDEFVQREGESHSIQDDGARPRRSCPNQFVSVGRTSLFYIPARVPSEDLAHERVPIRRRWSDAGSLRPRRRRSKGSTSRASEGCETVFLVWAHA